MKTIDSEKYLESKLRREVRRRGGAALKLLSQFHRGLPDRLILLPGGIVYFVEMKTTGEKPTALQVHAHEMLAGLGQCVLIIDTNEKLDAFLQRPEIANLPQNPR